MIVTKRERKHQSKITIDDSSKQLKDNWRIAKCEDVWEENEANPNTVNWKK